MISTKRRRLLIKKTFQLKYTGIILSFIILTAIVSSVTVYMAIFPYLTQKLANVYPQGRLVEVLRSANIQALIYTSIVIPFAIWISVILSHRIAGPWYRIEGILRDIAEGRLTSGITLRRGDELQSLAGALNELIASLKSSQKQRLDQIVTLETTLEELEQELAKEPVDKMKLRLQLTKINEIISDLNSLADSYKTV